VVLSALVETAVRVTAIKVVRVVTKIKV